MKEVEVQESGSLIPQTAFVSHKTELGWVAPSSLGIYLCVPHCHGEDAATVTCPPLASRCQVKTSKLKQTPEYTSSITLMGLMFWNSGAVL